MRSVILNKKNIKVLINENPDQIFVDEHEVRWDDTDSVPFIFVDGKAIVGEPETETFDKPETHWDLMVKTPELQYFIKQELPRGQLISLLREKFISGRLWLDSEIISFWKTPSKKELPKIIEMLNKACYIKITERVDIKNFLLDINEQLIPIKRYINSIDMDEIQKNDLNTIHTMSPEEKRGTPQMRAALKAKYEKMGKKLRKNAEDRDVTQAEYEFYHKYGLGESISDDVETTGKLNSKIWVNNKINSNIRVKLLDIAYDFFESLNIRWVEPIDIIVTGSIANFDWNQYSDISLHIVLDYSKIYKNTDILQNFFDKKKIEWERSNKIVRFYGFPVDINVMDQKDESDKNGVFSLKINKWLSLPSDNTDYNINQNKIKNIVNKFMDDINQIEKNINETDDNAVIKDSYDRLKKLLFKLKEIRKQNLNMSNELTNGVIIYKILRKTKYVEKLFALKSKALDMLNSLK